MMNWKQSESCLKYNEWNEIYFHIHLKPFYLKAKDNLKSLALSLKLIMYKTQVLKILDQVVMNSDALENLDQFQWNYVDLVGLNYPTILYK